MIIKFNTKEHPESYQFNNNPIGKKYKLLIKKKKNRYKFFK